MEESHTPNPSDSEGPNRSDDTDQTGKPRKLRLKKLLTPISPHLTAARPERDPRLEDLREQKEPEEAPRAVPVEPEPEPVKPPEAEEPKPLLGDEEVPQETVKPEYEEPAEDVEAPEPEPEPEPLPRPDELEMVYGRKPDWRKRLVLWLGAPVLILAAIVYLVTVLLDPFGQSPESSPPAGAGTAGMAGAPLRESTPSSAISPLELSIVLENLNLAGYLDQLRRQELVPSETPRGLYVNSVFIPEGSLINPRLGLTLAYVEISPVGFLFDLQDAEGTPYRVAIEP